jgi:putative phosphoribosyl transferase
MSASLHFARRLQRPVAMFADRAEAGLTLAGWISPRADPDAVVFALPRGGVPVGRPLADVLRCELRPALVRKLPVPDNPEMGFGAVAVNGSVQLNQAVVDSYHITRIAATQTIERVRAEVERRAEVYPGGWPLPDLTGRSVWLVDDGLATGLTMLTAAAMLRALGAASLSIAVPCSPADSLSKLSGGADAVWCFAVQDCHPFSVASFYRDFRDLDDAEVRAILQS